MGSRYTKDPHALLSEVPKSQIHWSVRFADIPDTRVENVSHLHWYVYGS